MEDELLDTVTTDINPKDTGGESVLLRTKIYANGDPGGIFINQEFTINSYCNRATFDLVGAVLTPDILRKMANDLEEAMCKAKAKTIVNV
ncbi:MAG: hypothetical protein AABY32_01335 [Nanoarchaeota archaeon]